MSAATFDYSKDKENMVAERYRKEQTFTREEGIKKCRRKKLAVECYAGQGTLTAIYKSQFDTVIDNDINIKSPALHHMSAMLFIEEVVHELHKKEKLDLIDLDCYGSPAYEIQHFFKCAKYHTPFVLCLSDGLGMWLKRTKNEQSLRRRYLIPNSVPIDWQKIWERHPQLIDAFIKQLCDNHGLKGYLICSKQTKNKNYVLASYKITKPREKADA